MRITYDPAKRDSTLRERGLDMVDAAAVFDGPAVTIEDDRRDRGETRYIAASLLADRMVLPAWTPREGARRIISTRKANHHERALHERRLR